MENTAILKGKRILVTGGAGFIGSNLAKKLLEIGAKVVVIDNLSTGFEHNITPLLSNPNFEWIKGDISDLAFCRKSIKNIDMISHQAALGSVPRSLKFPELTNQHNVTGFLNILVAAKEVGIQRIVYASSSSVYGSEPTLPKVESRIGLPLSPYAVSKYTNELYANVFSNQYGMELIGLRYFNVFGPHQDPNGAYAAVIPLFIHSLMQDKPVYINGNGNTTRDFTYVDNAVLANICGLCTQNAAAFGEAFNVACGQNYSLNQLFEFLKNKLRPTAQAIYREERAGDIRNSLADITKSNTYLGYTPIVNFEEGLKKTIDWYSKIGKNLYN